MTQFLSLSDGGWSAFNWACISSTGEEPEHTCALPPGVSRNDAIPYEEVDGLRHYDKCRVYVNYSASTNETEPCPNGWVYDDSVRSIVSKVRFTLKL